MEASSLYICGGSSRCQRGDCFAFAFAPVCNCPIAESSRNMLVISVPYYAFWLLYGHMAVEAHGGR